MRTNFKIGAVLSVLLLLLLVASRFLLGQREAVANLRAELEQARATALIPISNVASQANVQTEVSTLFNASENAQIAAASPPQVTSPNAVAEDKALRQLNEALQAQLRETELELADAKRRIPEPEDRKAAYVGPGAWINADPQTPGITKLVISGKLDRTSNIPMMVQAWGRCHPMDCDWGPVPLLLSDGVSDSSYVRGFAVWEHIGHFSYVIVTFEKAGLRVEYLSVVKNQMVRHRRRIERMTRLY